MSPQTDQDQSKTPMMRGETLPDQRLNSCLPPQRPRDKSSGPSRLQRINEDTTYWSYPKGSRELCPETPRFKDQRVFSLWTLWHSRKFRGDNMKGKNWGKPYFHDNCMQHVILWKTFYYLLSLYVPLRWSVIHFIVLCRYTLYHTELYVLLTVVSTKLFPTTF